MYFLIEANVLLSIPMSYTSSTVNRPVVGNGHVIAVISKFSVSFFSLRSYHSTQFTQLLLGVSSSQIIVASNNTVAFVGTHVSIVFLFFSGSLR